jgi:hypothetical protein
MSLKKIRSIRWSCFLTLFVLSFSVCARTSQAQMGSVGTLSVIVLDPSGGVVQGAKLVLQDQATNAIRNAETQEVGSANFASVPLGLYKLTVSKAGFENEVLSAVVVQGSRVTDVKVTLRVGATTETLVVDASATPLIEATSSAIVSTIDMKQIEDLPLGGRDVSALARLTPGFSGTPGGGTWNGLPDIAQGNTIDGIISSTSRMKFSGNVTPQLQARIEDLQEMTVQTSQLDLNQGMGMAAMQVNFVTRRGSNDYHGRVFEDFRNTVLNANTWTNNALGRPRTPIILNEFGGSVGGHIIKDKLFFFGSFAMSKRPGGFIAGSNPLQQVLTPLAQQGIFTDSNGNQYDLFKQIAQPNGLPATVNTQIAAQLALINKSIATPGTSLSNPGDPNLVNVNWLVLSPITQYFPAVRVDYNVSQKFRIDFSFEETKYSQPNNSAPLLPGPDFGSQAASAKNKEYIASIGLGWTISPTLINQFRGGYFYNTHSTGIGSRPDWVTQDQLNFAVGTSGSGFNLPITTFYPVINFADSATWMHRAHTVNFGVDFYREQDHYYNAPDGIPQISMGLATGDPAFNDFESYPGFANLSANDKLEAENLYATLVGRITSVNPIGSGFPYNVKTGQYATTPGSSYALDELQKGWGLYGQDSYKITPRLTINFGLRWDFTGDDHDLTAAYHGAGIVGIYGPSGVGNVFKPGVLTGDQNPTYVANGHQYHGWYVTPQPTIGLAWNPAYSEGFLGKLFGGSDTVIRAGFDIKRFTEPYQYFWNSATNHGLVYFQGFQLNAANGGAPGTFTPGSLTLGDTLPPYLKFPPTYQAVLPQSLFTWNTYWQASGFDPHIKQPYLQEWNLGVQRQLGRSNVLEVRYLGHRTLHQWIVTNPNEVNIFENGFLKEFKNAQANLTINAAHGITSFADNGYAGQQPLPIFDAAFGAGLASGDPNREGPGGTGVPFVDYANGSFITDLNRGAAGALATQLAYPFGTVPYICNLVGSSLSPCGGFGSTSPGPYPVNFFQANPYADGGAPGDVTANGGFMSALGYSDYHALQVDFRQKQWHGMQFDVNYTYSHTLGLQPDGQWTGAINIFTIRNLRQSYGPTTFDLRHVMHASGTFDLPFGHGKALLNRTGALDKVVGGWTLGTIFTYETGFPFQLTGGYNTFNDYGQGGLLFNGVSPSQLQSGVGVYAPPCAKAPCTFTYKYTINPALLGKVTGTCTKITNVCLNTTPATFGSNPWLYGPHLWNDDLSLSKVVPLGERVNFSLQAEFLNVFNHPNWANPNANVTSSSFGHSGLSNMNTARQIELRANITF